jgi:hypothetical protein
MHDNIGTNISDRRPVHVVAWGGDLLPGTVLSRHEHVASARSKGAVLLPVDGDLIEHPPSGADGWAKREYGEGVAPSAHVPSRCCPITVRIEPGRGFVHWAIELAFVEGEHAQGTLRLGSDTSQRGTVSTATQAAGPVIDVEAVWGLAHLVQTVHGVLPVDVRIDGLLGLSIYGAARGVRIRKVAVSVCSREA